MKNTYFVKLTKIEKDNFNFYGNNCDYNLDVFNDKKQKIGYAIAPVVQQGTDYSSAYEFLYDYNANDEEDRASLAEMLNVEEIADEWFDEDGTIDPDSLPKEICEQIEEQEDEMLIDYYYEEFAELADENGFLSLSDFAEHFSVRSSHGSLLDKYGDIVSLDINSPLSEMFEERGINGWYEAEEPDDALLETLVPDITGNGKELFVYLTALIAYQLDDMDMLSSYINIRYDGEHSKEEEAKDDMKYIYVEIAYITLRTLVPRLDYYDEDYWENKFITMVNSIGHNLGFTYRDDDGSDFRCVAHDVYESLTDTNGKVEVSKEQMGESEKLIDALIQKNIYPMSLEKYNRLLEDREIDLEV